MCVCITCSPCNISSLTKGARSSRLHMARAVPCRQGEIQKAPLLLGTALVLGTAGGDDGAQGVSGLTGLCSLSCTHWPCCLDFRPISLSSLQMTQVCVVTTLHQASLHAQPQGLPQHIQLLLSIIFFSSPTSEERYFSSNCGVLFLSSLQWALKIYYLFITRKLKSSHTSGSRCIYCSSLEAERTPITFLLSAII